jgi:hypothetical protein
MAFFSFSEHIKAVDVFVSAAFFGRLAILLLRIAR